MPEMLGEWVAVAVPALVVWAIVRGVRHPNRSQRGGASAGFGAALVELDRLVARPSAEFVEEAQTEIVDHKADPGEQ